MNTPVLLYQWLLHILRSNFMSFGKGGESNSTLLLLCDIKDVHMLTLNSLIFFSCLRRMDRPYLYFEWFIMVGLSWTYKSSPRYSVFIVAFSFLVTLGSAVWSFSNWITLSFLVVLIQFLTSNPRERTSISSQNSSTVRKRKAGFLGSSCYKSSFNSQWVWIRPWTPEPEHLSMSWPAN